MIELFWVLLLRGDRAVEFFSNSATKIKLGGKPAKGRNQVSGERVYTPGEGGLGLAAMGFKCSGDWPGASSTSVAGIPWSGMIPLVVCGHPVDRNPSSKSVSTAHCGQSVSKARESFTREQSERLSRPQPQPVSWSISKMGSVVLLGRVKTSSVETT